MKPINCIDDLIELAKTKDGKCLSFVFDSAYSKYKWECSRGHQWEAAAATIRKGHWCGDCAKNKPLSINDMHETAKLRNGKCLSNTYNGISGPLTWMCEFGHVFNNRPGNIRSGQWCPYCSGRLGTSINDLISKAKENRGFCLSDFYVNSKTKYKWKCEFGHEWNAVWESVKSGTWCHTCAKFGSSLGEKICREVLEKMFKCNFFKKRPNFMKTITGKNLELDGYSEKLKIAFEYQGRQHYEPIAHFGGDESYKKQIEKDKTKQDICKNNSIKLIIIPEFKNINNLQGCIDQIEYQVMWAGIKIPKWKRPKKLTATENSMDFLFGESRLLKMKQLAESKGGKLLSLSAMRTNQNLEWECAKGHIWNAPAYNVEKGSWCRKCAKNSPKNIDHVRGLAAPKGGKLINNDYRGINGKYTWECSKGHTWLATAAKVSIGRWCPECAWDARKETRDKNRKLKWIEEQFPTLLP